MTTSDRRFVCLTADTAVAFWDQLEPLFLPAVEKCHGDWLIDDVLIGIADKKIHVAVVVHEEKIELAIGMNIIHHPQRSVLNILIMGGKNSRYAFKQFDHIVKQFARDVGCTHIQASCGEAEARLFNHLGGSTTVRQTIRFEV